MRTLTGIMLTAAAVTIIALVVSGQGQGKSSEAVACSTTAGVTIFGKPLSLTGKWESQGKGRDPYWIRQIGSCVWWYGESSERTATSTKNVPFANVLFGTVSSSGSTATIVGVWADVPKGESQNSGTLILGVTPTKIVTRARTGGFSKLFTLRRAAP